MSRGSGRKSAESKEDDEGALIQSAVTTLRTMIHNLERGDAPFHIICAHLSCMSPADLRLSKAFRLTVSIDTSKDVEKTEQAELFEHLCGTDSGMSASLALLESSGNYYLVNHAIPKLVQKSVKKGEIDPSDESGLIELFSVWMRGVNWENFHENATSRPSNDDWRGWPWEADIFAHRSLFRGVSPDESEAFSVRFIRCDINRVLRQVSEEEAATCVPVFLQKDPHLRDEDIEEVVMEAITRKRLMYFTKLALSRDQAVNQTS